MSETAIRRETVTAWAPYIAIIVTIVVTVGGAAWSIGGGLAQLGAKVDGSEAKLEAKIDAVEGRLEAKIDAVEGRLEAKIDAVEGRLEAKIDAVAAKVEANAKAIRDVLDVVEANRRAIAANSAEIGRLGGRLDEHRSVHAEHERRHELAAAPAD